MSAKSFDTLKSVARLRELATHPFDLTAPGALSAARMAALSTQAAEWRLIYAMQRLDDAVLDALFALADEAGAVTSMERMQRGEVLNAIEGQPSEQRAVLHTAMRDLFEVSHSAPAAAEAARLAKEEHAKLQRFVNELDKGDRFSDLIMVGIGGSDLGPRALYYALESYRRQGRRVHFIANVDPDDLAAVCRPLDLSRTLAVVVSKSGSTLETATNEALLRDRFVASGLSPQDHFIAVTGQGSPMDDPSQYRECFYMWDYVGGRYSATSMVGGVMLAFALGHENFLELLQGAHAMDRVALERDPRKNLPLLMALIGIWNRNFLGCPTVAVIPYAQALWRFPAHLQQCDMESNGKRVDRQGRRVGYATGPVLWGEPGTNGQHSFFQLLHQGTDVVPVEFVGFRESSAGEDMAFQGTTSQQKLLANLFAQSIALATGQRSPHSNREFPGNRPNSMLLCRRLEPRTLGSLLALYEHKIAFQGFLWGINSFDQEGVQLGKVLAGRILDQLRGKGGAPFPEADALQAHLEALV